MKGKKSPVTKGAAKVPVIMQMEALECGAASLTMVMAYYGKWVPLEQVREDCGVSRDGSNAKNVLVAARSYGFTAKGYRYEPDELKKNGKFPCIIHWNFNHFVVLDGFKGNKAVINDPARGLCYVLMEEFDKSFTGICLMIEPGESFVPGGKPKSVMKFVKNRLQGAGTAIAFVVICSLISALMGVIQPGFSRIFYDRLLTGENPDWFVPFMTGLAVISGIQIIVSAVEAIYSKDTRYCTGAFEPPCTERYARWCERSAAQLMGSLLLDFKVKYTNINIGFATKTFFLFIAIYYNIQYGKINRPDF